MYQIFTMLFFRFACESDEVAEKMLSAGKMWYKMHKIINTVPFQEKYKSIMDKVYSFCSFLYFNKLPFLFLRFSVKSELFSFLCDFCSLDQIQNSI